MKGVLREMTAPMYRHLEVMVQGAIPAWTREDGWHWAQAGKRSCLCDDFRPHSRVMNALARRGWVVATKRDYGLTLTGRYVVTNMGRRAFAFKDRHFNFDVKSNRWV